ncbi:lysozyme inhibitor LprI family protein [Paraburkholderia xenovorans]|uniref:lysozyme inhibitor LprI family protein n=1 Tax=Paraburkholderia xenovorans TaxID=36873 RepID=UPI0038B7ADBA
MTRIRPLLIAALMLAHPFAHATSFDCNGGRSLTEKMICNDPALSKLDDTLGQLYWKARRRVTNRRAFLTDSDSKWAWREANCRDAACLGTWYATRIEELRKLIDSMQAGTPLPSATPVEPDTRRSPLMAPAQSTEVAMRQCTAANPGIVVNEQCSTVLRETRGQWKHRPHGGDWFCGVAMLAPAEMQADAAQ